MSQYDIYRAANQRLEALPVAGMPREADRAAHRHARKVEV